jgi:hypothetical protein
MRRRTVCTKQGHRPGEKKVELIVTIINPCLALVLAVIVVLAAVYRSKRQTEQRFPAIGA